MFNTTHHHRHSNNTYVNETKEVIEKRAPTDESVRLLNEMQDAAYKNILGTIHVKTSTIDAIVIAHQSGGLTNSAIQFMVKFNINGKEFVFEGEWSDEEVMLVNRGKYALEHKRFKEQLFQFISAKYAKIIADKLVSEFTEFDKVFRVEI